MPFILVKVQRKTSSGDIRGTSEGDTRIISEFAFVNPNVVTLASKVLSVQGGNKTGTVELATASGTIQSSTKSVDVKKTSKSGIIQLIKE